MTHNDLNYRIRTVLRNLNNCSGWVSGIVLGDVYTYEFAYESVYDWVYDFLPKVDAIRTRIRTRVDGLLVDGRVVSPAERHAVGLGLIPGQTYD
jgi:hypothetical protein